MNKGKIICLYTLVSVNKRQSKFIKNITTLVKKDKLSLYQTVLPQRNFFFIYITQNNNI